MRTWRAILVAGSALVLAACSTSTTAPLPMSSRQIEKSAANEEAADADSCDARSGYYVRSGRQTDEACTP